MSISLLQMAGEYLLLGRAGHQMAGLGIRSWWNQSALRVQWVKIRDAAGLDWLTLSNRVSPSLSAGGYLTMFICSANPFSFMTPPFVRLTGVIIWRTAKLRGSALVLSIGTCIRLAIVYAGILGARWVIAAP